MAGHALPHSKKSWNGMKLGEQLLLEAGMEIASDLPIPGSVAADDVLDVAHWHGRSSATPEESEKSAGGSKSRRTPHLVLDDPLDSGALTKHG